MKISYRCGRSGCRALRSLTKPIEEHAREPRCHCGGKLHDYRMNKRRHRRNVCNCDGLPYPHRSGSSVWCKHHPAGPTDEDYEERYGR